MSELALTLAPFAGIAAGLAGLVYIFKMGRKAWRATSSLFRKVDALLGLAERELKPNGGGSLHDKITRIDESLNDHLIVAAQDHDDLVSVKQHLGLGL